MKETYCKMRVGGQMVTGYITHCNEKTVYFKPKPTACVHINSNFRTIKRHKRKHNLTLWPFVV